MFLGYDDEILSIAIHGKGDRHDSEENYRYRRNRWCTELFSYWIRGCGERRPDTTAWAGCRPARTTRPLGRRPRARLGRARFWWTRLPSWFCRTRPDRVGRSAGSAVPHRPLHLSPVDAPACYSPPGGASSKSAAQLPALRILIAKIRLSPFWIPAWG